jgi:hypothetical protein
MMWRYGLRHPLGLGLLGASLALALLSTLGGPWRDRELWLALTGVVAYTAVTATVALRRPTELRPPQSTLSRTQNSAAPTTAPAQSSDAAPDWVRCTEEALRHLREPAALAKCQLAQLLPGSLALARGPSESPSSAITPLERAQLLRAVLEASMEKLRLAASSEPAALEYEILRSEYVVGLPNTAIMTRYSVSEGSFHRRRRSGVQALAAELQARESQLA